MTRQVSLLVNDAPIALDYFVQAFIDHTVGGMIEALEGAGQIKNLNLSIDGGKVAIDLNGASVEINAFVTEIIKATTIGMVSSLKGVRQIKKLRINITR
jgi:hypothetical protein